MDFGSLWLHARGTASQRLGGADASSCGSVEGATQLVYTEEAFRHFLLLERKRAQASGRTFLFVMVSLTRHGNRNTHLPAAVTGALFSGLAVCVREIDFIGWYRDGRIAGAVLTQGSDGPGADAPHRIADRVNATLREGLPARIADRLRVRVLTVGRPVKA